MNANSHNFGTLRDTLTMYTVLIPNVANYSRTTNKTGLIAFEHMGVGFRNLRSFPPKDFNKISFLRRKISCRNNKLKNVFHRFLSLWCNYTHFWYIFLSPADRLILVVKKVSPITSNGLHLIKTPALAGVH